MTVHVHAWEKQSQETSKSHACFMVYLKLGPTRTLSRVAAECTKSESLIRRWSARHGWVARAAEFDAYTAQQQAKALAAKEVESRLRRSRHGELVEVTGVRAIQQIAAEVAAGTRQLSVSEAATLTSVGARMDRDALQSAPAVQVNVGVRVNVAPSDQIDPDVDDELGAKMAACYLDRWMKKYPGRSLPPLYQGERASAEAREAEIQRTLRAAGAGQ